MVIPTGVGIECKNGIPGCRQSVWIPTRVGQKNNYFYLRESVPYTKNHLFIKITVHIFGNVKNFSYLCIRWLREIIQMISLIIEHRRNSSFSILHSSFYYQPRCSLTTQNINQYDKKLLTPTGEQISFLVSSNASHTFLEAKDYNTVLQLEKELKRQYISCDIDFSQKLGWFVRVPNHLAERIKYHQ